MTKRVESLDVARGTAMLFVCLSHFVAVYLAPWNNASLSPLLSWYGQTAIEISMIATPIFVGVSGMLVAYLYCTRPFGMNALRRKLIDRGLFLIIVGHVLQAIPRYVMLHGELLRSLNFVFITDVIGLTILIGPALLVWMSARARLVTGTTLLVLTWGAAAWNTHGALTSLEPYAFGGLDPSANVGFPFVPWFGVYLVATVVGEVFGRHAASGEFDRGANSLLVTGLIAFLSGVGIRCAVHATRRFAPALLSKHGILDALLAIDLKFPPGPTYLLLFGGAGLAVVWVAFRVARAPALARLSSMIAALGRASFFVFIIQGYVYYIVLPALPVGLRAIWPVYYVITVVPFFIAARIWNSFGGNRYLSVGVWRLTPILRAFRARVVGALAIE